MSLDVNLSPGHLPVLKWSTREPSTSSSLSLRPFPSAAFPHPSRSLRLPPPSSLRRLFGSLALDAAPKLDPPGRRRLDGLDAAPPVRALANFMRLLERDCCEGCIDWSASISSGGGEPDEGVEGDGEPGSGGEFMFCSLDYGRSS